MRISVGFSDDIWVSARLFQTVVPQSSYLVALNISIKILASSVLLKVRRRSYGQI